MYFWLTPRGASGPTISALTMSSVTIEQPAWLATFLAEQGDRTADVPSDRTQLVAQHVVRAYWVMALIVLSKIASPTANFRLFSW